MPPGRDHDQHRAGMQPGVPDRPPPVMHPSPLQLAVCLKAVLVGVVNDPEREPLAGGRPTHPDGPTAPAAALHAPLRGSRRFHHAAGLLKVLTRFPGQIVGEVGAVARQPYMRLWIPHEPPPGQQPAHHLRLARPGRHHHEQAGDAARRDPFQDIGQNIDVLEPVEGRAGSLDVRAERGAASPQAALPLALGPPVGYGVSRHGP